MGPFLAMFDVPFYLVVCLLFHVTLSIVRKSIKCSHDCVMHYEKYQSKKKKRNRKKFNGSRTARLCAAKALSISVSSFLFVCFLSLSGKWRAPVGACVQYCTQHERTPFLPSFLSFFLDASHPYCSQSGRKV